MMRSLPALVVSAVLVASCSGSESGGSDGGSTLPTVDDTSPIFEQTDGTVTGGPQSTTNDTTSGPTSDTTVSSDVSETGGSTPSSGVDGTVVDTVGGGTTPVGSDPGANPITEIFPADAIDDVPFCQAYAEFFQVFIGISLASSFGGLDPEANPDGGAELLEVFLYPSVVDDVGVMRDTAPDAVLSFFTPIFARVDRAVPALEAAGFTSAEIDEIRAGGADVTETGDVEGDFADDPRVDVAVDSFRTENGTLDDVLANLDGGDEADAASGDGADAFFRSECPNLSTALDEAG